MLKRKREEDSEDEIPYPKRIKPLEEEEDEEVEDEYSDYLEDPGTDTDTDTESTTSTMFDDNEEDDKIEDMEEDFIVEDVEDLAPERDQILREYFQEGIQTGKIVTIDADNTNIQNQLQLLIDHYNGEEVEEPDFLEEHDKEAFCNTMYLPKQISHNLPKERKEKYSEEELEQMSQQYQELKMELYKREIKLDDIMAITDLNSKDKANLLEKFGIRFLEANPMEYLAYRRQLREELEDFKTADLEARQEVKKFKKSIKKMSVFDMRQQALNIPLENQEIIKQWIAEYEEERCHSERAKMKRRIMTALRLPYDKTVEIPIQGSVNEILSHVKRGLNDC